MKITESLVRLRDDLKTWVANNLLSLDERTGHINDNGSGNLSVIDKAGNTILCVDKDGVKTTAVETSKMSGRGDDSLTVQDSKGNAVLHVDAEGMTTTKVTVGKLDDQADELFIADRGGRAVFRVNANGVETTKVSAKEFSSEAEDLVIVDENRNAIVRVDANGVETTKVTAKKLNTEAEDFCVADGDNNAILRVDKDGVTTTQIVAQKLTGSESEKLEIADGNRNIIFRLDSDGIDTVGLKINGEDVGSESVLYTEQTLTEEQQAQARANIGAVSADEVGTGGESNIIVDSKPTANSENPVSSGGVYTALSDKQDTITGTAGQFVVIGDDGAVTTKTIASAEEASF